VVAPRGTSVNSTVLSAANGLLLGGQSADLAQRQRHLGVGGQRRVAAREDQA
jgi:hypothetical protein